MQINTALVHWLPQFSEIMEREILLHLVCYRDHKLFISRVVDVQPQMKFTIFESLVKFLLASYIAAKDKFAILAIFFASLIATGLHKDKIGLAYISNIVTSLIL